MTPALELGGAFLLGLMGTPHCITMCGPVAALSCGGALPKAGESTSRFGVARRVAWVQLGRALGYATLGALAGGLFGFVERATHATRFQLAAKIVCGMSLFVVGLLSSGVLRSLLPRSSRMSDAVSRTLGRLLQAVGFGPKSEHAHRLVARGVLWGFLPCGLVYGALTVAMSTGSAPTGALVMAAFFAGTLPAITAIVSFLRGAASIFRNSTVRLATGLLMALAGALQVEAALANAERATEQAPAESTDEAPRPCCHGK
jgi:sulfite exporter TauE/SafE